jgi:hypothetical protein
MRISSRLKPVIDGIKSSNRVGRSRFQPRVECLSSTTIMFGFGSSSSSSSSSSTTPVAGAAPNREERAACWTARDAYFTCLDQNGVIAAGDDKGPCQREKKGYEGSCSRSWVSLLLSFGRDGTGANDRSIISTRDGCWR